MSTGSNPRGTKDERRARLAEVQAAQQRAERRRTRLIVLVCALVVLALVVPAAFLIIGEQRRQSAVDRIAAEPIEGETVYEDISATHVSTDVEYEQSPPVGGDHSSVWLNCGFYSQPVPDENAVHSLEHGAVWITHDPELPEADVQQLRELTERHPYVLVSPYEGLPSPVVATAWGIQVELESVDDERLEPFLRRYLQGPQTPEPGAACHGGVGA